MHKYLYIHFSFITSKYWGFKNCKLFTLKEINVKFTWKCWGKALDQETRSQSLWWFHPTPWTSSGWPEEHKTQYSVVTARNAPDLPLHSRGICQWSSPAAVRPDSTVRTNPAWWAPRSQERDWTTPGQRGGRVTRGTETVRRSSERRILPYQ